jgi:hypothetical protein
MKIFNRIIIALNTLMFLTVGAFFIMVSINQSANKWMADTMNILITYLNTSFTIRIIVLLIGAIAVFTAVITVFGNIRSKINERTVILQSPLGDILVSLSAIEDFSKVIKNQIAGIKDIKGKVRSKRKGFDVTAWVSLYSDRPVADVTQEVQEAIIQYIKYTLSIDTDIKPKVIVSKISYKIPEEAGKHRK